MVPLVTPARRATSSSLAAAKPRSTKTSSAAATISSGRASLRRRHRGERGLRTVAFLGAATRGITTPKLVTERSVTKPGSLVPSSPPVEEDQACHGGHRAHLAQQRHDLTSMVGGVVHSVVKHLAEGVLVLPSGGGLHGSRLLQLPLGQPPEEPRPLRFDLLPPRSHVRAGAQVLALGDRRVRLLEPAVEPEVLRPDDVRQCAVDAAMTALQVALVQPRRQGI